MKKVITAIVALVIVALMVFGYMSASQHAAKGQESKLDPKEVIAYHCLLLFTTIRAGIASCRAVLPTVRNMPVSR